jgi:hypothetical protein
MSVQERPRMTDAEVKVKARFIERLFCEEFGMTIKQARRECGGIRRIEEQVRKADEHGASIEVPRG